MNDCVHSHFIRAYGKHCTFSGGITFTWKGGDSGVWGHAPRTFFFLFEIMLNEKPFILTLSILMRFIGIFGGIILILDRGGGGEALWGLGPWVSVSEILLNQQQCWYSHYTRSSNHVIPCTFSFVEGEACNSNVWYCLKTNIKISWDLSILFGMQPFVDLSNTCKYIQDYFEIVFFWCEYQ